MKKKKINLNDDTSLIFCFDISGSMDERYEVDKDIYDKVKECLDSISSNKEINENMASDMLLSNNNNYSKNNIKKNLNVDELDNKMDYSMSNNSNYSNYSYDDDHNSFDFPEYNSENRI